MRNKWTQDVSRAAVAARAREELAPLRVTMTVVLYGGTFCHRRLITR